MHTITSDKLTKMRTKFVVRIRRDMMELIHRNQPIIKRLHSISINGKSKGSMCTNQYFIVAFKERSNRFYLAHIVRARGIT
ncbi:hypothetical protein D1872_223570 [compost metagenome]